MRPRGSFGEVAIALRSAAFEAPGTVAQLAERACVGYDVARYTASRLVSSGELVKRNEGRPAILAAPPQTPAGDSLADRLDELHRSFWERGETQHPGSTA